MTVEAAVLQPRPSWFVRAIMFLFRVLLLTILFTGLGMALGLLAGILWNVINATLHHVQPDMTSAYKNIAIPCAIASGSCALLWNLARGLWKKA